MPYRIGGRDFRTKQMIREHVRELFGTYGVVGDYVTDLEDHAFLLALLSRHPEHQQKEGKGVERFERGEHPEYGSPCFIIHRVDRSSTDFSTETCIRAKRPSLLAQFREACSRVVDERVRAHKDDLWEQWGGSVQCPKTGQDLDKSNTWLVQTEPSWADLVGSFLEQEGHSPSMSDLTESRDNQYWPELVDSRLAKRFFEFHESRMNLVPKLVRR